jgi:uncharacterized OB-fold protein
VTLPVRLGSGNIKIQDLPPYPHLRDAIDPKEVAIGMRVEVAWDDVTPEISLPKFRPIQK